MTTPSYDELPVAPEYPPGSSWGLWGEDDRFGTLNLIDDAARRRGIEAAIDGTVYSLNLALEEPDPPLFERSAFVHEVTWLPGESGHDDSLSNWNTQSSSQWDGFRHIRHPIHGFYNGIADEEHGIHLWAQRGIVTRAVLCDVGRYLSSVGRPIDCSSTHLIDPTDVLATLDAQGSPVEPGDILLIRTGWLEWYGQQPLEVRQTMSKDLAAPGLAPGKATAKMLWDLHVAAVAGDNPALEAWPATGHMERSEIEQLMTEGRFEEFFVHFALLPLLGIPIGEFFQLEQLAQACAMDHRYSSLFTSAPLNLHQGVASPPNALAIR